MKLDEIKELIKIFGKSKLERIQIKEKDFEIKMEKATNVVVEPATVNSVSTTPVVTTTAPTPVVEEEVTTATPAGELITSPMVGTFYCAPSPDSPPFVKAGDSVRKGQTLCILEAMKIMNELEAEFDCKILEVLVEDGEPVEYDKPLFRVEKL